MLPFQPDQWCLSGRKIQSVGCRTIPNRATVIDRGDSTLLPGFVNAHTHLPDEFKLNRDGATLLSLKLPPGLL